MDFHMRLPFLFPVISALLAVHALPSADPADLILHRGTVLTMDDARPRAEAVAVTAGRIVAVGTDAEVLARRGDATRVMDLGGRTLLPGFVDAHGHVTAGGIQALSANLLPPPDGGVRDIAGLQATLRAWIAEHADAVRNVGLVVGFGYDHSQFQELRHPTREELDAVTTDVPLIIIHQSGHILTANSKALAAGGIDASTQDPAGGVIRRKAGGREPDGVLEETAAFPLIGKLLGKVGRAGGEAFVKAGTALWARYGYTTAQEGRATPGVVRLLRGMADAGALPIDVAAYSDVLVARETIPATISRTYQGRFRVAGLKLTIDGSVQGFTAWRDRPYYRAGEGYPPGYVGYPAASPEQVGDAIDWAHAKDYQIIIHSNGEAASDQLIAQVGAARRKHGGGDRRTVLIHGQLLREDQVDALRELGIIPSLFPMHTFYWGDWHRERTVGPQRADDISPTGWCVQRGMRFTTHHDAPVAFPDSMRVLDATVTRRSRSGDIIGPAHRVEVMTALKAMTLWPAWQHFEEDRKGSIEVGKLADLVVLDRDPTSIDPEQIDGIVVDETIKEGVTVYRRDPAAPRSSRNDAGHDAFTRYLASAQGAAKGIPARFAQGHVQDCNTCLCHAVRDLTALVADGGPGDQPR